MTCAYTHATLMGWAILKRVSFLARILSAKRPIFSGLRDWTGIKCHNCVVKPIYYLFLKKKAYLQILSKQAKKKIWVEGMGTIQ